MRGFTGGREAQLRSIGRIHLKHTCTHRAAGYGWRSERIGEGVVGPRELAAQRRLLPRQRLIDLGPHRQAAVIA